MNQETKKIIALACSPSKGRNSDTLLDYFIEGANSVSGIEAEKFYLNDIYIDDYDFENRLGPKEDEKEFEDLCNKIMVSEALVIAAPTYNFSVPSHLKKFIDRIRFFALDFEKLNMLKQPTGTLGYLKTFFIVTGGTPTWAQKILFFTFPPFWLRGVFLYYGAHVLGAFYTGDVMAYQNKRLLNKCKKRGVKFAKHVKKGKKNRFLERVFFRPPQVN